jgi:hypothetical protein
MTGKCRVASVAGDAGSGGIGTVGRTPFTAVLRWHTMAEGLDWLPEEGVVLTRADLERIFVDLRALIGGTAELDPNRAHAVDIAVTITQALDRNRGDD